MTAAWIAACSIIAVAGCSRGSDRSEPGPDTRPTPNAARAKPMKPVDDSERPAVVLASADSGELRIVVEVVRTPRERNRGLMYRQHLPLDRGMLFVFDREEVQSFWMKNTLISLDLIFIRKDLTVAGIVENAEPKTLTSRKVDAPSTYVLEVNAGWSKDHGVGTGATVRFENIEL